MTGWLPHPADTLFGPDARAEEAYDVLTVDVPAASWTSALGTARSVLGCTFFDWLSAVDEPGTGFLVSAHLVALAPVRRLLLRTTVPHEAPVLESAVEVFAGAAWHERETHEMFGVSFTGHPALDPLLLPENFEGHPLRKDFVLAARVVKAWPGAKEPGEGPDHGGPKRRQMLPPGVPDPNEWGPLKGTLPAAPARPARRTASAGSTRPPRRTRAATGGSASQGPVSQGPDTPAAGATPTDAGTPDTPEAPEAPTRPRRNRSASQGSASQQADSPQQAGPPGEATGAAPATPAEAPATPEAPASPAPGRPRRNRSASQGSASQQPPAPAEPAGTGAAEPPRPTAPEAPAAPAADSPDRPPAARPRRDRSAADGSASQQRTPASGSRPARAGSSDAPWHHAKPAREETPGPETEAPEPEHPARPPRSPEENTPDDDTPTGGDPA
ncbi:NADH-ubiquinone oxidoreductase chain C [Streptomyces sp. GBA 94-10 4N24]|uniref:NADH-quinone oxidoreductase subunit C n=1 Tax=Streptomyces TaxID=1883 RepID=UPI0003C2CBB9|nr:MULTISPECIES: NADH-quinone oxidoreductase subunit C [unclassified Streptomyces]ESP98603.1 NADH-ubiquinone oxidoreductase chain C [Streptomyces sp. GBA 94-10 4N24]ESQ04243.1 NADH-ubiquinone oxidoreductase chain C [Streptomyces sp. PVA_94-07]UZN60747.1 NADH-ubiquinone oxidoreductase chain C [Streptomyces sp. GBA 94-10 4N24]